MQRWNTVIYSAVQSNLSFFLFTVGKTLAMESDQLLFPDMQTNKIKIDTYIELQFYWEELIKYVGRSQVIPRSTLHLGLLHTLVCKGCFLKASESVSLITVRFKQLCSITVAWTSQWQDYFSVLVSWYDACLLKIKNSLIVDQQTFPNYWQKKQ